MGSSWVDAVGSEGGLALHPINFVQTTSSAVANDSGIPKKKKGRMKRGSCDSSRHIGRVASGLLRSLANVRSKSLAPQRTRTHDTRRGRPASRQRLEPSRPPIVRSIRRRPPPRIQPNPLYHTRG